MFATCVFGGIRYGTGRHMADLEPESAEKALRVSVNRFTTFSVSLTDRWT